MPASAAIRAFLEFFKPMLRTVFFPTHWLLSHFTIVQAMDSCDRGMNPVALHYHQSLERILAKLGIEPVTPVLKYATLSKPPAVFPHSH